MGALRILGAAALVAGIVGLGLFFVWAINYYVINGVRGFNLGWGPIEPIMILGLFWGTFLLVGGFLLYTYKPRGSLPLSS